MPRAVVQTTLRVDAEIYEQAQAAAKRDGVSLNEWITTAMQEKLDAERPKAERPNADAT